MGQGLSAQADPALIELVVKAGTPLRVALDDRVVVKRAGQMITGTIVEPLYAYDRIVVPVGAKVTGHIARLEPPSKMARASAYLNGDFTPFRRVTLQFDSLLLDGCATPIETVVTGSVENVQRLIAGGPASSKKSAARTEIDRAREQVEHQVKGAISGVTQPGRMGRLKEAIIRQLPYHPQRLIKGTVYLAELTSPLSRGTVVPIEYASAGAPPASILSARLITGLDSSKSPRESPVTAVLTAPLFSSDHRLILPEGTELKGTVTFSRQARHFHRNGQLRFLIERVETPERSAEPLLASLYSVQAGGSARLAVDDEGGVAATNSKVRFVAPALAILAMSTVADPQGAEDVGNVTGTSATIGKAGSRTFTGFLGLGVAGSVLSHFSTPVAIGLGTVGVARTVYSSVFGKGKEVSLPASTPIQVQLAAGPAATQ
jgi:hypothetical protein